MNAEDGLTKIEARVSQRIRDYVLQTINSEGSYECAKSHIRYKMLLEISKQSLIDMVSDYLEEEYINDESIDTMIDIAFLKSKSINIPR